MRIIDLLIESDVGDYGRFIKMEDMLRKNGELGIEDKNYFSEKLKRYKQLEKDKEEHTPEQKNLSPISLALLSLIPLVDLWVFWKLGQRHGLPAFILCGIIWGGAGFIIDFFLLHSFYLSLVTGIPAKPNELNFGYILAIISGAVLLKFVIVNKEAGDKQEEDLLEERKDAQKQEELEEMKTQLKKYALEKNPIEDHMEILKLRYAKGEITKEEFEKMKDDLK